MAGNSREGSRVKRHMGSTAKDCKASKGGGSAWRRRGAAHDERREEGHQEEPLMLRIQRA